MPDTRPLSPSDLYEEEREVFGSLLVTPRKPARPSGLRIGRTAHNGERDRKGITIDRRSAGPPSDQTC